MTVKLLNSSMLTALSDLELMLGPDLETGLYKMFTAVVGRDRCINTMSTISTILLLFTL